MSDVMSVRLDLSGVCVRGVLVDTVDRLEVEVESTREWSRCRHYGFRCYRVWHRRAKRVRDLGVSGRRTTLVWRRRRVECGNCGERHLEDHAEFQAELSRRFARRLIRDATVMSMSGASRHHGVGWHRIMGLVSAEAARAAQRRRARPSRVLLVDETSIRRRRGQCLGSTGTRSPSSWISPRMHSQAETRPHCGGRVAWAFPLRLRRNAAG